ncbi:MAG: hypothetical protein JW719_01210 [Pirellulales bacterium]|nr:hypothetical protein [Pirellulales bacterium]
MRGDRWRQIFFRFLVVGLLLGFLAPWAAAATKWKKVTQATPLKIGQRVQVEWFGQWIDGRIVGFDDTFGHIRVRFRIPGRMSHEIERPVQRSDLRIRATLPRSSKSKAKSNPFETSSGNPFEPDKGFREWKDDTGSFKIEAELVKVEKNAVRLKRRDGRMVTVPLDRLCEEDRRLIEQLQGADEEEDAEEEEEGEEEEEEGEDEEAIDFLDDMTTKDAHWDNVTTVYFRSSADPSKLEADGGVMTDKVRNRPVELPPKKDFFERPLDLRVAAAAPDRVMVPYSARSHGQPTRFALCDLAPRGARSRMLTFPASAIAMDLSPDGKQVISCPNGFGFGAKARVDLWNVEKSKPEHLYGWKPYAESGHGNSDGDVRWAAYVDQEHVLTCGDQDKLVLWKLPEVEAVYTVTIARGSEPALSAGRKHLALLTRVELAVLDAKTGEVLGTYLGAGEGGTLAFRPDGKGIAQATTSRLIVWELINPKPYRDIGLSSGLASSKIAWPAKNYVLVGNRYLVDLEKYSVLWDYQGGELAATVGRQFWCLCCQDNNLTLVREPLPHRDVLNVAERLTPDDFQGIEPGATVSIEVNVTASEEERQEIRENFEQQLAERGMKVATDQPIKLVVCTKLGEMETISYEMTNDRFPTPRIRFGPPSGDVRKINFQTQISQVSFLIDGKEAWEMSSVTRAPHYVQLEEGETAEQAVLKFQKPNLRFFDGVQIPSYVAKPGKNVTFGASRLTPQGLQPGTVQSRSAKKKGTQDPMVSPAGDRRA